MIQYLCLDNFANVLFTFSDINHYYVVDKIKEYEKTIHKDIELVNSYTVDSFGFILFKRQIDIHECEFIKYYYNAVPLIGKKIQEQNIAYLIYLNHIPIGVFYEYSEDVNLFIKSICGSCELFEKNESGIFLDKKNQAVFASKILVK